MGRVIFITTLSLLLVLEFMAVKTRSVILCEGT